MLRGKYKKGWDKIREERIERLKASGLIPEDAKLSPPSANINTFRGHPKGDEERRAKIPLYRPWNEISEPEQDELDLEMAVFAAMVDCMDQNIGRVLNYLDEKGIANNIAVTTTFIVRLVTLWFAVLVGIISVSFYQKRFGKITIDSVNNQ